MKRANFQINNLFLNIYGDIKITDDNHNIFAKTEKVFSMKWSKNVRFNIQGEQYLIKRVKIGLKQTIRKIFKDGQEIGEHINITFPIKELGAIKLSGLEYKIHIKYEKTRPFFEIESNDNLSTISSNISPVFMFQNSKGIIDSKNEMTNDDLLASVIAIYSIYLAYNKVL